MLLPFTNAVVPTVDLAGGRVVIELPQEIEGDDPNLARDRPELDPAIHPFEEDGYAGQARV